MDLNTLYFDSAVGENRSRSALTRKHTGNIKSIACDTKSVAKDILQLHGGQCEGHASPLHLAVRYGNVDCVAILMKHGASPLHVDATGYSPYQTVIWERFVSQKRLFLYQDRDRKPGNAGGGKTLSNKTYTMRFGGSFRGQTTFTDKTMRANQKSLETERQIELMNREHPENMQVLSLKVTHSLLDKMGSHQSVQSARSTFAYFHLAKWVLGYAIALILFMVVSLPRSSDRYLLADYLARVTEENEWSSINTIEKFWSWSQSNLIGFPHLFPPIQGNSTFPGLKLLGAIRIRQIRSASVPCDFPSQLQGYNKSDECFETRFAQYITEETSKISWDPDLSSLDSVNQDIIRSAQTWRKGTGIPFVGVYETYSTDGYYFDVDLQSRTEAQNLELFSALGSFDSKNQSWVDLNTRFLIIIASIYNMNLDMFGHMVLTLEIGVTGELITASSILCETLTESDLGTYPSLLFKIVTFGIFLFFVSEIFAFSIRSGVRSASVNLAILFDFALAGLFLALFILDVYLVLQIQDLDLDFSLTDKFQSIDAVINIAEDENYIVAVTIFLLWLGLAKFTILVPPLGSVTYGFVNTIRSSEVFSYLALMFYVIWAYVCSFRSAFGQVAGTASYTGSFNLLTEQMIGQWSDEIFSQLSSPMRTVMYISYMMLIYIIFLNLFVSVIQREYPNKKKEAFAQCNDAVTGLMEKEFIMNTHPLMQKETKSVISEFIHSNIIFPAIANFGIFMRVFNSSWNFDIPKQEFGWERGREFFKQKIVAATAYAN